jgi:hypothetical protein
MSTTFSPAIGGQWLAFISSEGALAGMLRQAIRQSLCRFAIEARAPMTYRSLAVRVTAWRKSALNAYQNLLADVHQAVSAAVWTTAAVDG